MTSHVPRKIHIIGSVGSGKTTLAKQLSRELNTPYYELDNVVWERHKNGDIRRTPNEREVYLSNIIETDAWIMEGVHNEEWVYPIFKYADVILFLDTNYYLRMYRIIKRFILQKLGLEKAHYKPTFKIFLKMFKWNKYFEGNKASIYNKLESYNDKFVVLRNNDMNRNVKGVLFQRDIQKDNIQNQAE